MEYMIQGCNVTRYSAGQYEGVELFGDSVLLESLGADKIRLVKVGEGMTKHRVAFHETPQLVVEEDVETRPFVVIAFLHVHKEEDARKLAVKLADLGWIAKVERWNERSEAEIGKVFHALSTLAVFNPWKRAA